MCKDFQCVAKPQPFIDAAFLPLQKQIDINSSIALYCPVSAVSGLKSKKTIYSCNLNEAVKSFVQSFNCVQLKIDQVNTKYKISPLCVCVYFYTV